jgi:hypothetical protein
MPKAIKRARAIAEMDYLSKVRSASDESRQAAAWYLERVYPDRYGRKDRATLEHTGANGLPLQAPTFVVNFVSPDDETNEDDGSVGN